MAPRPPAPGIIRIELLHEMNSQPCQNVLHGSYGGGVIDEGTLSDSAAAVLSSWEERMVVTLASAYKFLGVRLTDLSSESGAQTVQEADLEGGNPAVLTDAARALCVTMRTPLRTRSGRGRVYIPGISDASVANARHFDDGAVEGVVVHMEQFRGDIGVAVLGPIGMDLGVLSYFSGGALREAPLFTPMTRFTADSRIDHQRRRVGKH